MHEIRDGVKFYDLRRKERIRTKEVIEVFVLYHESDKELVDEMVESLKNKKIFFYDIDNEIGVDGKVEIIRKYDYFAIVVSEELLRDYTSMKIILDNFTEEKNWGILPLITFKDIYEPEDKSRIVNNWKIRVEKYSKESFDCFNEESSDELRIMRRIHGFISRFIAYAVNKDIKSSLCIAEKLVRYIEYELEVPVKEKESDKNSISTLTEGLIEKTI